ncbi:hypothetical protein ST201phi2-1p451 [Pseudomonas phage 201phi2-1]|uniref:Uncharacterized protein n=1 Tax=Pseudomonas phage 201phi2-1 TaxID=198110 RepID=B3FJV9_BP201|nr:hypothetical protein ST201phi2-1p451 [Pseudomonas phage 201phi2-1]ABY63274.1 hypothetical protein 201phi2-1p451 [Pseudomonas phage 201phi2-1]
MSGTPIIYELKVMTVNDTKDTPVKECEKRDRLRDVLLARQLALIAKQR